MKKLLLLALPLMMVGCDLRNPILIDKEDDCFVFFTKDSCEYLGDIGGNCFTHKGNCRFCAERRKQEIKELIEEIRK